MAILQTLQRTNWNKQEAAQILGLYRPTLYSKMKKHDIRDAGKSARSRRRLATRRRHRPRLAGRLQLVTPARARIASALVAHNL